MHSRVAGCVVLLLMGAMAAPACGLVDPCDADTIGKTELMTWRWTMVTLNGQTPRANGFPMPETTDRYDTRDLDATHALKSHALDLSGDTLSGVQPQGSQGAMHLRPLVVQNI